MVLPGARKCRACRRWIIEPPRVAGGRTRRSLVLLAAAVAAVLAVIVSHRSPVGEAPPLTELTTTTPVASSATSEAGGEAAQTATAEPAAPMQAGATPKAWTTRTFRMDARPLDLVFDVTGKRLYVSGDDGGLREIDTKTGRQLRRVNLPGHADKLRLLNDRYIAGIRRSALHIPVVDTLEWEKEAMLLLAGAGPTDIVALPDGHTAVTASSVAKRLGWFDLETGAHLGDIKLAHATGSLFLVGVEGRPLIGAMGVMQRGGAPVGAWLDLFDPAEKPFGATRRSIKVGRDPRGGAVTRDKSSILFADYATNELDLMRVDATTEVRTVDVDQGPVGAFLVSDDRFAVTINVAARTATVVDLATMKKVRSLMLNGTPNSTIVAPDGETLFVSLGGAGWPPSGAGIVVISGDPPAIEATLDTGRGASKIAVARDSRRAAVANFFDRSITVLQR